MANTKAAKADRESFASLDAAGLRAELENEKKKQWTNKFELGKRQLEKTADLGTSRKRIARINTYLRQLELKEGAGK